MMDNNPILSLCMPTNGVVEWVFPSLNSIFSQNVDEGLYEVIVVDNGNNIRFKQIIEKLCKKHENLRYYHTDKVQFLSEPESYKMARGTFIKFINHRNIMHSGSINYF